MEVMSEETLTMVDRYKVLAVASFITLIAVSVASLFYTPFLILSLYSIAVGTLAGILAIFKVEAIYAAAMVLGPLRLGTAAWMVASGIPSDNNIMAFIWLVIALVFVLRGAKNIFAVLRFHKKNAENMAPYAVSALSVRQQEKKHKVEENLVNDLFSFVDEDTKGKS